jgi:signal transduction histidine kinase
MPAVTENEGKSSGSETADAARLALAEQLTTLGALAASVGHEINNPLTYVITNLAHLLDRASAGETFSDDETRQCLHDALDGAERIRQVVSDMRTLGRARELALEPTDVRAALEIAVRQTKNHVRHKARLATSIGDLPKTNADSARLCQVFVNLILNAVHAIPDGRPAHHEISVSGRQDGDWVVIEVRDTGSGIAPEVLPHIFEPFFTTKAVGEGTGLGLAVTRSIVESFGGTIDASSTLGVGTTFEIRLRKSVVRAAESSESGADPAVAAARRARLLVIDDDHAVLRVLERTLGREHEVETLSDAREALRRLAHGEHFDLVLCDVMMPEMTGMELHQELMRRRADLAPRVVFMTGGAFTPEAQAFFESITNPRIMKPFHAVTLRDAVRQALVDLADTPAPRALSQGGAQPVPSEISLRFPRDWDNLDVVRESCGFFARAVYDDPVVGQRVRLVVHELVENAIKYSVSDAECVNVDICGRVEGFEVVVTNRATGDRLAALLDALAELDGVSGEQAYVRAMERSLRVPDGPGIGLARIATEARVALSAEFAQGQMRIVARGAP